MKQDSIFGETWKVLVGEAIACPIMCLVFFLVGKWEMRVLWGALLGLVGNMLCFLVLCLTVEKMIRDNDIKKGLLTQKLSYFLRLGMMAGCMLLGYYSPYFHPVAVIIPLLLTRPILTIFALIIKPQVTPLATTSAGDDVAPAEIEETSGNVDNLPDSEKGENMANKEVSNSDYGTEYHGA